VEVANDSSFLKPGMFTRVEVTTAEKDEAQIVPSAAVVNRSGEVGIFLVKRGENIANYILVQTGIIASDQVEIVNPPIQGEVVTLGQHLLDDGSPIILPQTEQEKSQSSEKRGGKGPRS
jgi:multidrug efflux pump subunit AcrA (membrane-fusion protein)